ncbi:alpha/beta hydrolase [Janthinobacterium sp. PC23-8]|nr:alpha/beta hydrolase [Janthinobacterium sp. PC23-8]
MFMSALMPFAACQAQAVPMEKSLTPDIGGITQFIDIKTDDASKPVLLFLSGGPGSSMIRNADAFTRILQTRFTIVQWDQRDAGKTLQLNRSPVPPSVALIQADTLEVVKLLRKEFRQDKIYLLGSSWGNVLGFHVVKQHPELLHAYFAVNPVVSQLASEQALLATLKDHFKNDPAASGELARVDTRFTTDDDLFYVRKWLFYKDGMDAALGDEFKKMFFEWTKTWSPVWKDVMTIDLRDSLRKADCPVYFFVGKNDIQTSTRITRDYFDELQAPRKKLFLFERSGHQIHKDEPEKLQQDIISTL